ncbi:outer membrane autotransporter barrel domain-containing protein [Planoprotostelium fungivorum]|uniref:receptor protein-tyrosine kinase n=1 Tax=Planoprotostelium fungivorum TaxID=1890364 RepID=A0A2P6MYX4_9EUKA|nr:outer membrane autotransporter barrel domain-containing protein [Planoprotostelium fungivorum]
MSLNCAYYFKSPYVGTVSFLTKSSNTSGNILWITGSPYGTNISSISVKIGLQDCNINSMNNFNIYCTVPSSLSPNIPYVVNLIVQGNAARSTNSSLFMASASNATALPTTGGTSSVQLYSFSPALLSTCSNSPSVTVGTNVVSSSLSSSGSTLSFVMPAGSGIFPMVVTCGNNTVSGYFAYNQAVVYGVSQSTNPSSPQISIWGNNFGPTASGIYMIWVGNVQCKNPVMVVPHTMVNCTLSGTFSTSPSSVQQNAIFIANGGDSVVPNVNFVNISYGAPSFLGPNPDTCRQKCLSTSGCKSWTFNSCGSPLYACYTQNDLSAPSLSSCKWGGHIISGASTGQTSVLKVYMNNPLPSFQFTDRLNTLYNLDYYADIQDSTGNVDFDCTDGTYSYSFNPGGMAHGGVTYNTIIQKLGTSSWPLLNFSSVAFTTNSNGVTSLTGGGAFASGCTRQSIVALICDASLSSPVFSLLPSSGYCINNFSFRFNCSQAATTPYFRTIAASSVNTASNGDLYLGGQWGVNPNLVSVYVAGISCPLYTNMFNNSMLVCASPPMLNSSALITVLVNGQLARNGIYLWSVPKPAVFSVSSPLTSGGTLSIFGCGFGRDITLLTVNIGGNPCPVTFINLNGTTLFCNVSAGTGAGYSVSVTLSGYGELAVNLYMSYTPPIITSITSIPTNGGSMTITGNSFGSNINQILVTANKVNCPLTNLTATTIVCTAAKGVGIAAPLVVTVNGLSSSSAYRYQPPTLSSYVRPNTMGGDIQLVGTNFGNQDSDVNITSGGNQMTTSWMSGVRVTLSVPAGTGSFTININIGGQSINSIITYNAPTVTVVTSADTVGGLVNITGNNFGTDPSLVSVTVQSVTYNATISVDHTMMSFAISPGVGANLVMVIKVNGQTASTRYNYNPPSVTSVSGVTTDGGAVTVTGANLGPTGTRIAVTINSIVYSNVATIDSYTCLVTVGAGVGTNYPVLVNVAAQISPSVNLFGYFPPVMTSSSVVSTRGPSTVVITGQNFGKVNSLVSVNLGGLSCGGVLIYNSSYLTCSIGDGFGGTNLSATMNVGNQNTTVASFSFLPPNVTSATAVGTLGGRINIAGSNFGNTSQVVSITVGSVACTSITMVTKHSLLQCTLPGDTGIDPLTITVNGQNSSVFTYKYSPPLVTAVSRPNTIGGNLIVNGNNFGGVLGDISVSLCSNVTINTANSITCIVPSGSGYNIGRVITVNGQSSSFLFSYNPPSISSATNAPTAGGTITISGYQYSPNSTVTFGRVVCGNIVVGPLLNLITCTLPAGTGVATLIVTSGNQSVSVSSRYIIPTITSASSAPTTGGTITLFGSNLGSNPSLIKIVIDSLTCGNIQMVTPHLTINCDLPANVGGNLTSVVTVDTLTSNFNYSYIPPAVISTSNGPTLGGVVTITGTNMGSQPSKISVVINGMICGSVTYIAGIGTNLPLVLTVGGQSTTGSFSYQPPTISSASFSGVSGGIYLSGSNFGNNASVIDVTVTNTMDNSTTICSGISIENPSTALNCTVTGVTLTRQYLVQMTVDGQMSPSVLYTPTAPRILNVTSAPTYGGSITITGSDFQADVQVTMGGNLCNISSSTQTTVNCIVGPMSGDGRSLTVDLTSSGISVSSAYKYQPPTITSTTMVPTLGGNITINGTNFPAFSNQITVFVDNTYCYPLDILQPYTSIRCRVTAGTGRNNSVDLSVLGASTQSSMDYLPPVITSISNCPTMGGIINIHGSQLGNDPNVLNITANGAPCLYPYVSIASTMITCNATAGTGALRNVTVGVDGQSTTGNFSYISPNPITATSVSTAGGIVNISGSNFGTNSSTTYVTIDGQPCLSPVTIYNYTTITCQAQPDAGALLDVSVTVDGLTGSANVFNFFPPSVYSVTMAPTTGGMVVVDGQNFGTDPTAINVTVNGLNLPVNLLVNHTKLTFNAPNGTLSSSFNLTVQGQTVTSSVSYLSPNVTLVTNPNTSGTNITIRGSNFGSISGLISVVFPSASGDITVNDVTILRAHTVISCIAPSGTGSRPLRVVVNTLTSPVYNLQYQNPTINTTNSLNSTGGTLVITGDNFGQLSSLVQVNVGTSTCGSVIINTAYTVLTCTLSTNIIGAAVPITVTVDNLVGQGSYRSLPPYVFSITSPPTKGGQVTITGINFGAVSNVTVAINGKTCTVNTTTATDSFLTCNVGRSTRSHQGGNITSSGQTTTLAFVPYQSPNITSITYGEPNGSLVTISGNNFGVSGGNISVAMDNLVCKNATVTISDTTATCVAPPASGTQRLAFIVIDGLNSSTFNFNYYSPVITMATAVRTRGDIATLSGAHFGDGAIGTISVRINNITCPIDSSTVSTVRCSVGAGVGTNLTGSITVYNITSYFTFSYLPPIISSTTSTNTTGGSITISGDNFGTDPTLISIIVGSDLQCTSITMVTPHTTISCQLDPGTGINLPLYVTVNGSLGAGNYSYLPPVVTMVTRPPTRGGTITFSGVNFGGSTDTLQPYFNGQPCMYVAMVTRSYSFSCTVTNNTGSVQAYVIVDGVKSNVVGVNYQSPIITSINPAPQSGGYLYIIGANFGDDIDHVDISLPCQNTSIYNSNPETLSCYLGYDYISNVTFNVSVSGQTTRFTGAVRFLTVALYVQYAGVLRLMSNASRSVVRPTQNFCFNFTAIQCTSDGNIRSLDLSGISLSTSLDALCDLIYLEYLHLRSANATGGVPACLDGLTSLREIDLGENTLQGNIPDLSALSQLYSLRLDNNRLDGSVPSTLGNNLLSILDVSTNDLIGFIPSELTMSSTLVQLFLRDNYLSGFSSVLQPIDANFTCNVSSNFLACPLPPWVSTTCHGICGQSTVSPTMNVMREILRAVYSQTTTALFYFTTGTYSEVDISYLSTTNQSVSFEGVGGVKMDKSKMILSGAFSASVYGFTFDGSTLTSSQCSSLSVSNSTFYGNRATSLSISGVTGVVSLFDSSFLNNFVTPIVLSSSNSSDLILCGCNVTDNVGQAISISGYWNRITMDTTMICGNTHQLLGTVGITAPVEEMHLSHVTWSNNSATSGAALYTSAQLGRLWASDLLVELNSAYAEGGAFVFAASIPTFYLQNSTFRNNSAQTGGAMSFKSTSGNVTLYNTSFAFHTAAQGSAVNFDAIGAASEVNFISVNIYRGASQRGAVHLPGQSNATFVDCTFIENSGGSLYGSLSGGTVTTIDSRFYNNTASEGSGIALYGTATSVTVSGSTFYGNKALAQGADITVELILDVLSIYNSTFTYSTARFQGGGVNLGATSIIQRTTLVGVTMRGCSALFGSALAVAGQCPTVTVRNSNFKRNNATFEGAAVYIGDQSTLALSIISSKFDGNFASSGGAIKYTGGASSSVMVIDGSVFTNNQATSSTGGAIIVQNSVGNFSVSNSYFGSNGAQSGGAIYLTQSIPVEFVLRNITFEGNSAHSTGGAICLMEALNSSVVDCTFQANQGSSGSAIWASFSGIEPITFNLNHTRISQSLSSVSGGCLMSSLDPQSNVSFSSYHSTWYGNKANFNGGGLLFTGTFNSIVIEGDTFSNNNASTGGAVSIEATVIRVDVTSSSFVYNSATQIAGGLSASSTISRLSIYNSSLLHNTAPTGGAIYNSGTISLDISFSDISYNSATSTFGGGMLYQSKTGGLAELIIYNSTVRGNVAKNGGGLYVSPSTTTDFSEYSNFFSQNSAASSGGAVSLSGDLSTVTCVNSTWSANSASDGAALYINTPSPTIISHTRFHGNNVTNDGGAVSCTNAGVVNITESTFDQNKAGGDGGGLLVAMRSQTKRAADHAQDRVYLSDLEFVDNVGKTGGGLNVYTPNSISSMGTMSLYKSLFQSNRAVSGGGVAVSTGSSLARIKFEKNVATSGSAFIVTNPPGGEIIVLCLHLIVVDVSLSDIEYVGDQQASVPNNVTLQGGSPDSAIDCGQGYTSFNRDNSTSCIPAVKNVNQGVPTSIIVGVAIGGGFIVIIIVILVVLLRYRSVKSRMRPTMEFDLQTFTSSLPKSTLINESELKNLVQIGRGAFGIVYKAHWRAVEVAVKQLVSQDLLAREHIESFVREVHLLERLRPHPNVVLFLGVVPPPNLALVTEYCEGGDLLSYIHKNDPSLETRKSFILDIAVGMLHLHNENIIHRDLAARNILLTGALRCKVTDFGFSRQTESSEEQSRTTSTVGPLKWMAPEALMDKVYSNKSDVYSFAITMWDILTAEDPYSNRNVINVAIEVAVNGLRPALPVVSDQRLLDLMQICWDNDPVKRPDFEIICAHLQADDDAKSPSSNAKQDEAAQSDFGASNYSSINPCQVLSRNIKLNRMVAMITWSLLLILCSAVSVLSQSSSCVIYSKESGRYADLNWAGELGEASGDYLYNTSRFTVYCQLKNHDRYNGNNLNTMFFISYSVTQSQIGSGVYYNSTDGGVWNASLVNFNPGVTLRPDAFSQVSIGIRCDQTGVLQPQLSYQSNSSGILYLIFTTRCFSINTQTFYNNASQILNITIPGVSSGASNYSLTDDDQNSFSCVTPSTSGPLRLVCACNYTISGRYSLSLLLDTSPVLTFTLYIINSSDQSLTLSSTDSLFDLRFLALRSPFVLSLFIINSIFCLDRDPYLFFTRSSSVSGTSLTTITNCVFYYNSPRAQENIKLSDVTFLSDASVYVNGDIANLSLLRVIFSGTNGLTNPVVVKGTVRSSFFVGGCQVSSMNVTTNNITIVDTNFIKITAITAGCFFSSSPYISVSGCTFDCINCAATNIFSTPARGTVNLVDSTFINHSFAIISSSRGTVLPLRIIGGNTTLDNVTMSGNQPGSTLSSGVLITDANVTLIGCTFSYNSFKPPIYISTTQSSKVRFDGLNCRGNSGIQFGGCIYSTGPADIILNGANIWQNSATALGGGIYLENTNSFQMKNFNMTENQSQFAGGAIYLAGNISDVELTRTIMKNNKALYGAGIGSFATVYDLILTDCQLSSNIGSFGLGFYSEGSIYNVVFDRVNMSSHRKAAGGASIYITNQLYSIILKDSHVFDNSAPGANGGAIYIASNSSSVIISNSTISGCSAAYGSAIYLTDSSASLSISNSVISDNSATNDGGAIWLSQLMSMDARRFECRNNNAGGNGGCVYIESQSAAITMKDSIINGNKATGGAGFYMSWRNNGGSGDVMGMLNGTNNVWYSNTARNGATMQAQGSFRMITSGDRMSLNTNPNGVYNLGTSSDFTLDVSNLNATRNVGGALLVQGVPRRAITISDSYFDGNTGVSPIYISPSSGVHGLNVTRCTALRNIATGSGGAIFIQADNGNVRVDSSIFSLNRASEGGAIFISQSLSVSRSTNENNVITLSNFTSNGATTGGALSIAGSTEMEGCSFDGNVAGRGGSLNLMRGDFLLRETSFTGGDSVYLDLVASLSLYNVTNLYGTCPNDLVLLITANSSAICSIPTRTLSQSTEQSFSTQASTPPDSSSIPPSLSSSSSLSTKAQIGIIVGCIVGGLILIILLSLLFVMRRRKTNANQMSTIDLVQKIIRDAKYGNSYEMIDFSLVQLGAAKRSVINFDELQDMNRVGGGAFGVVYKAAFRGIQVAVKQIKSEMVTEAQLKDFLHEVTIIQNLRSHPHVVSFVGLTFPPQPLSLITEFCSGGSLDHYIERENPSQTQRVQFMEGIALGMVHLHAEGIIHRDLAARNILLTNHLDVKVSDFGMSRMHKEDEAVGKTQSNVGPLKWMAPEALKNKEYSNKSDSFSYGVTCWEILMGQEPYRDIDPLKVAIDVVTNGLRPVIPEGTEAAISHMMTSECDEGRPSTESKRMLGRDAREQARL